MKKNLIPAVLSLLLAALIWLEPIPIVRFWSSFAFLWILPGLTWLPFLEHCNCFRVEEKITVALGLNFVITPFVALSLAYLPGPMTKESLLVAIWVVTVAPVIWNWFHRESETLPYGLEGNEAETANARPWWKSTWLWLIIVLLLAAGLRLINLDYSEFQGDEAAVLVKSARIIVGEEGVIFQHKKGPVELLLTMAGWRLTGITSEWMARLAFAWASILSVAGIFHFGLRQGSLLIAVIAGGFLAIEGYLVGFGRIVQYQSLVILTTTLALLCLLVFAKNSRGTLLIPAAAFFAVGLWAHYDAILFLPAGVLLTAGWLIGNRHDWRKLWVPVLVSGLIGLLLAAYFYSPFLSSAEAEGTLFYVTGRIGSGGLIYNHLFSTINRTFVYDSVYFLGLLFCGLVLQIAFTWRKWGWAGVVIALGLILAAVASTFYADSFVLGKSNFAWVVMALLFLGSLVAPQQEVSARALWLWLGVPAMFYLFFVALPLTHVYTAVPGATLLAAIGLVRTCSWLARRSRTAPRVAAVVASVLFVLGIVYAWLAFVNHSPEYLREYPESKTQLYWTPFGDDLPREGLFGFPYRAGWKSVGHMIETGNLRGSYDSNEERDITDYYTRQARRFDCATPDTYITAVNVQDEVPLRFDQIEAEFSPSMDIMVNGQPKIRIHQREFEGEIRTISDRRFSYPFDLSTTPESVAAASPVLVGKPPTEFFPIEANIGDFARLIGYQLDTTHARPGGYIELHLLWEALSAADIDYQVFTHLYDGQDMLGQLDGQPVCNSAPTSRWQEGSFVVDPYRIPIDSNAATGRVPLTVGMYNLANLQRLPVNLEGEDAPVDSIYLTDVMISENG